MGFRFRRSLRLLPGIRLNLGKRSGSVSIGVRGAKVTLGGPAGPRATVGLPGSGASYTTTAGRRSAGQAQRRGLLAALAFVVGLALVGTWLLGFF